MVYINLNPLTGDGGYIIGEGLNGGYTVGEWTSLFKLFWQQRTLTNITANFAAPAQGQQFTKGDNIRWTITYSGLLPTQPLSWYEFGDINSDRFDAGNQLIMAGYGATASVSVVINAKTTLGTHDNYNNYDDVIIEKADKYDIPRDLLKSLIHQEALKKYDKQSGQYLFKAHSYRYEAHKDYDWYSRQDLSVPAVSGWRGLGGHPESHFAIGGYVATGGIVPSGDQIPNGYCYWSDTTAAGPLKFPDNKCKEVTAAELVALNSNQKWPSRQNWNFTAQLVLSASYGLCQTMYETAVNRGFDTRTESGQPAKSPEQLFDPEVSVELGAFHLKKMYGVYGNWWDALKYYNGGYVDPENEDFDSEDYADAILKTWNNGNGIYKEINY